MISNVEASGWMPYAACKGMDPELFFPERGEMDKINLAKDICNRCLVVVECFDYGMNLSAREAGIYGGTTSFERLKLKRLSRHAIQNHKG
jgi:WhiB family redox-sensing transcriptional regulator